MESVLFLIIIFGVYFLPWIIAIGRKHHNRGAICALNLFLGWTLLGWVVALVWAYTNPVGAVQTSNGFVEKMPRRSEVGREIEHLVRLKKAGEISEEEFSRAKQRALQR